jgi:hypothetical protein
MKSGWVLVSVCASMLSRGMNRIGDFLGTLKPEMPLAC